MSVHIQIQRSLISFVAIALAGGLVLGLGERVDAPRDLAAVAVVGDPATVEAEAPEARERPEYATRTNWRALLPAALARSRG